MEAKEKAEELFDKYYELSCCDGKLEAKENAKKCALICVDEILSINKEIWDNLADSYFEYWQEVKQEILNL